jgi:type IV secretory pathway protease TraF
MAEPAKRPFHWPGLPASAIVLLTLALAGTLAFEPRPLLLWNATGSSPIGLYEIKAGSSPLTGETVIAWPPPRARRLAAIRHYLPARVPLVKPVAATSGSRICARRVTILVDGRLVAFRRRRDPSGRLMPWWSGCKHLSNGDLFLLSPGKDAFDGRYFGVTRAGDVIGTARLLWRP